MGAHVRSSTVLPGAGIRVYAFSVRAKINKVLISRTPLYKGTNRRARSAAALSAEVGRGIMRV